MDIRRNSSRQALWCAFVFVSASATTLMCVYSMCQETPHKEAGSRHQLVEMQRDDVPRDASSFPRHLIGFSVHMPFIWMSCRPAQQAATTGAPHASLIT